MGIAQHYNCLLYTSYAVIYDQKDMRTKLVRDALAAHGEKVAELDGVVARGGLLPLSLIHILEGVKTAIYSRKGSWFGWAGKSTWNRTVPITKTLCCWVKPAAAKARSVSYTHLDVYKRQG